MYHWVVEHKDNLKLGNKTDIGAFSYLQAEYGIEIGDNVQIGSHCSIYSISTIDGKKGKVIIGENACIGSHSTIMPDITIGKNAIVGAHSFVNRDVPDNVTVYGVPAKIKINVPIPSITDIKGYIGSHNGSKISTSLGKWTSCRRLRGKTKRELKF